MTVPLYPKAHETPQEHIRAALMLLMNPHHSSHGLRSFTVEQVADMSRLMWRAVNKLEGRADA